MKKGLVLVACAMILLVVVAAGAVAGVWYFFLRSSSADKAFATAVKQFSEGDYVQYKSKMTADLSADLGEESETTSMIIDAEGRMDIKNKKDYQKIVTTTDNQPSTKEIYYIGNDMYVKSGDGEFVKTTLTNEELDLRKDIINYYKDYKDYTLLAEEEVDGKKCYHYKITISDEVLKKIVDSILADMDTDTSGFDISNISVTGGTLELWVSKAGSDNRLLKKVLTLDEVSFSMGMSGFYIEAKIKNAVETVNYMKWGEKVEINAPV